MIKTQNLDAQLVKNLIADQFPQYENLEVKFIENGGNDNRTFRLGKKFSVRLPSHKRYASQVKKENKWLPYLSANLNMRISKPIAQGVKSDIFPYPWSILEWIEGESVSKENIGDMNKFAFDLATFLKELHTLDITGGPLAGAHNFYRGGSLSIYDEETKTTIALLENEFDSNVLIDIWNNSLNSKWENKNVWVHGDVAIGNLLVDKSGNLSAVIDFGILGVGDPACDLVMYYNFFDETSRKIFKDTINLDEATFNRARGWALWKALITYAELKDKESKDIINRIIDNYES